MEEYNVIDLLILMACQLVRGNFMPRGYGIVFILHLCFPLLCVS